MRNLVFCFARCNIYIVNHPKGADCSDVSKWKSFTTPVYGNCFTFNSNESTEEVGFLSRKFLFFKGGQSDSDRLRKWTCTRDVSRSGAVQKSTTLIHHNESFVFLFHWIHIFQSNYMHNKLSRKAGARITIHDP